MLKEDKELFKNVITNYNSTGELDQIWAVLENISYNRDEQIQESSGGHCGNLS